MTLPSVDAPVRLGVLTDIQYANKPDRVLGPDAGAGVRVRRYSRALDKTRHAAEQLNGADVSATLHLGDIVDGGETEEQTRAELHAVLHALSTLHAPVLHVLGNHCLAAGRDFLTDALRLPEAYYARDLSTRWRLLVLDTVDVSVDRDASHPHHAAARAYLARRAGAANANEWNGAVGRAQLEWFRAQVADAGRSGMRVVAAGHLPVLGAAAVEMHTLWNGDELCAAMSERRDVVKAYFAGHYHEGGYAERDGVHHVTFEAVLDSQREEGSWGVVELHADRIVVHGKGDMTSRVLKLD